MPCSCVESFTVSLLKLRNCVRKLVCRRTDAALVTGPVVVSRL